MDKLINDSTVIVAIISVAGVLITGIITFLIAILNTENDTKKIYSNFSNDLYNKKLDHYPYIFKLLSKFIKQKNYSNYSIDNLNNFYIKLQIIDSKYSIYFNAKTVSEFYHLMQKIRKALSSDNNIEEIKDDLGDAAQKCELALKYELGSFGFSSPTHYQESMNYQTYDEAINNSNVNNINQ